ncbi:hypothetical protein M8494_19875 [Serratia ureilytica]
MIIIDLIEDLIGPKGARQPPPRTGDGKPPARQHQCRRAYARVRKIPVIWVRTDCRRLS